jgi:hypothetical protein
MLNLRPTSKLLKKYKNKHKINWVGVLLIFFSVIILISIPTISGSQIVVGHW